MAMRLIAAVCALGVMAVSSASGVLILNVNTTDKTFALTGSDTGTDSYPEAAVWGYSFTGGSPVDEAMPLETTQYSATPADVKTGLCQISLNEGGDTMLVFGFAFDKSGETHAISGTGVYASYASLGLTGQTDFESLIGHSLAPASVSSGWSNISVVAAAVPEPTSLVLLSLAAAALVRRRGRKA